MARKSPPSTLPRDSKQPRSKDRSNGADRTGADRGDRRSGEGSGSALASLKHIERDRARTRPRDENNRDD